MMSGLGATARTGDNAQRIGIIGLGWMGMGMARRLVGAGFRVTGYDIRGEASDALAQSGGSAAASPVEAAREAALLFVMVVDAAQVEAVLFGADGAVAALPRGAVVVLSATVPASFAAATAARLGWSGHLMPDAPVSGRAAGAASGKLTVMASGPAAAVRSAEAAFAAIAGEVYRLGGSAGIGSAVTTVH